MDCGPQSADVHPRYGFEKINIGLHALNGKSFKNLQAAACQCESSNPEWIWYCHKLVELQLLIETLKLDVVVKVQQNNFVYSTLNFLKIQFLNYNRAKSLIKGNGYSQFAWVFFTIQYSLYCIDYTLFFLKSYCQWSRVKCIFRPSPSGPETQGTLCKINLIYQTLRLVFSKICFVAYWNTCKKVLTPIMTFWLRSTSKLCSTWTFEIILAWNVLTPIETKYFN